MLIKFIVPCVKVNIGTFDATTAVNGNEVPDAYVADPDGVNTRLVVAPTIHNVASLI